MPPSVLQADHDLIWHPFTRHYQDVPVEEIVSGKGSYLFGHHKKYLDLISSWWVNIHGHGHPVIAKAIYDQAVKLEHVIFADMTHQPAVHLCQRLRSVLPNGMKKFFFSDNGSTSVEVALKMAYRYQQQQGQDRPLFLSFQGGYHGDTLGAMSVGRSSGFFDQFKSLFMKTMTIPFPATWLGDQEVDRKEEQSLLALQEVLEQYGSSISALIVEPILQGASGMRLCRPGFLDQVIACVRQYGILVIFDEVLTGFGRTGALFACQHLTQAPDFMCLSKALTGGFLPMALTVTTQDIFDSFSKNKDIFSHGHSYTANPVACAAAIASFDLLQTPTSRQARKAIHETHYEGLRYLYQTVPQEHVHRFRLIGTVSAWDAPALSPWFKKQCMEHSIFLRPLGSSIYFLPPYCTSICDLQNAYEIVGALLRKDESFLKTSPTSSRFLKEP